MEQTFGFNHLTGVLIGASIIVFYTLMGGFFAVAWTDFIQGIIMFVALVALPLVALYQVGGLEPLIHKIVSIDERLLSSGWQLFMLY